MPSGSVSTTSLANALKIRYPQDEIYLQFCRDLPLFGMLKKKNIFEGKRVDITAQYGAQLGVATNFTDASSNETSNDYAQFAVTRARLYGTGSIDGEALVAGQSKAGAIVNMLEQEMTTLMEIVKRYLSAFLWGNGGGSFGRVGAIATNTITLTQRTDVIWFEVGQVINLASTDGTSGSLEAGSLTISAVNRKDGILTFTQNVTTGIPTATTNMYIFVRGCFGNGAGNAVMVGVPAWITTSSSPPTLFGVTRTTDVTRLSGIKYSESSGAPIEESLQKGLAYAYAEGAKPATIFMNPQDYQSLAVSLGSKAVYNKDQKAYKANVGYTGVEIISPFGTAVVYADPGCPRGYAYALDMSTFYLGTAGPNFPYILGTGPGEDGLTILRSPTADKYSWRLGAWGNLICDAPGRNMVVTL